MVVTPVISREPLMNIQLLIYVQCIYIYIYALLCKSVALDKNLNKYKYIREINISIPHNVLDMQAKGQKDEQKYVKLHHKKDLLLK